MSYSSSPPKVREASKLRQEFSSHFGSSHHGSLANIKSIFFSAKNRLIIVSVVAYLLVLGILFKWFPKFILQAKQSYFEKDKICYMRLISYGAVITAIVMVLLCGYAYKNQKLKSLLFANKDCDICVE
jgi:hypothetical protein